MARSRSPQTATPPTSSRGPDDRSSTMRRRG